MAAKSVLKIGPVLSFRGAAAGEGGQRWKVTALIGIEEGAAAPAVVCDGREVAAPEVLVQRAGLTLLRYDLTLPLGGQERRVRYEVQGCGAWEFSLPAQSMQVRSAYVSCNGFSDPRAMRKLVHKAGAVWEDILANHDRLLKPDAPVDKEQLWHLNQGHGTDAQRFHVLLMGGDQVYLDSIWEDIAELKEWADLDRDAQLAWHVSPALRQRIADYYFGLYCARWLNPARGAWAQDTKERDCADALARIPTLMMWDDHDIFDGWGSYSPQLQACEVAQVLFDCARQAFWVFQLQHRLDDLPPLEAQPGLRAVDAPQFAPVAWSRQLATDPLALPLLDGQPAFSYALQLGTVAALVLDLRTERARRQILGEASWEAMERWLAALPAAGAADGGAPSHVLLLSSVPVVHPKLSVAEALLDSFGSEQVVESNADDLRDHWSHDDHEPERKRLTRLLVRTAQDKRVRIVLASGDVHVAAWGMLYRKDVAPDRNWLRVLQLTSSAVVHPAPTGPIEGLFVKLLNTVAARPQAIDTEHQCEMMLFPAHNRYVMAARNWLALEPDAQPAAAAAGPRLWATWRCEGAGGFSNHLLAVDPAPRG